MAQDISKMETTQTAVDYLIEMIRLNDKEFYAMLFDDGVIEQAKAIEKEQIEMAYANGSNDRLKNRINEQYYNETYAK